MNTEPTPTPATPPELSPDSAAYGLKVGERWGAYWLHPDGWMRLYPPADPAARAIVGKLTIAGNMVVDDIPMKGLFIEMTEEALRAVKHLPMYENVAIVSLPARDTASHEPTN